MAPNERAMRYRFALLALVLPIIGACSSEGSNDATTPSATTPSVSTTIATSAPAAGAGAVGIADFKFGPAEVHVPVGGSVQWTNNDSQQHTATSSTGAFDAGAIQPGTSTTVEFKTAGSFAYICSFHPFMSGTVVVG
jgi:plastocyanin